MPPEARARRVWTWTIRRVSLSALAGALTAVAAPWTLVRVLAGLPPLRRGGPSEVPRYEGLMPREEYERLIAEDLAWLRRQPPSPSRAHIEVVLRESPYLHYGRSTRAWVPEQAEVLAPLWSGDAPGSTCHPRRRP